MRQNIFVFPPKRSLEQKTHWEALLWTFFLKNSFFKYERFFLLSGMIQTHLFHHCCGDGQWNALGLVSFWDCGLSICLKKTYGPSAMRHNHEPPWHLLGKIYKSKLIFLNASCFETNTTFQFAVKSHLLRLITKTWVASKTYEWFIQMAGHCTNISKNLLTSLSLSLWDS